MDLDELLSYKPTKRSGEKRQREGGGENVPPPAKAARSVGSRGVGAPAVLPAVAEVVQPSVAQDSSSSVAALDLNGISYEEKLRILQTVDEEEEDAGESHFENVSTLPQIQCWY